MNNYQANNTLLNIIGSEPYQRVQERLPGVRQKRRLSHEKAWIVLSIATRQIRGGFTIFRFHFQFILYHHFWSLLVACSFSS